MDRLVISEQQQQRTKTEGRRGAVSSLLASHGESRPRRTRISKAMRSLVSETIAFDLDHIVAPIFVKEGEEDNRSYKGSERSEKEPIESMPGIFRYSLGEPLEREVEEIKELGIKSILLFGIPANKDPLGSGAYREDGVIQKAVRQIKRSFSDLIVICDVCMCEYTDHGHCGVLDSTGYVENDETAKILAKIAVSQAEAGADVVAPSAMIDHQVAAIRKGLDESGFINTVIMSYSTKFSSCFYGPFREAASSSPSFGDRSSYQMDPRNLREAVREAVIDAEEGADILMVKPALPYLDVIRAVKERVDLPVAAYQVSGEYSMIKAASAMGWLDGEKAMLETIYSIKRAGADILITYFAKDYAKILSRKSPVKT
jgi:porphobilinogen synthase